MSALALVKSDNSTDLEAILDSNRYELNTVLGQGCWGVVYSARDKVTGQDVAIKTLNPSEVAKKQMIERGLDAFSSMKKEALLLSACSNVVPRNFNIDNNGTPFIVMPQYEKNLSDILNDEGTRVYLESGLTKDQVEMYVRDLGIGIRETHLKLKRAHRDIKPDNVMIDDQGHALLTDFGSSTSIYANHSKNTGNIGFLYTRAPEKFKSSDADSDYDKLDDHAKEIAKKGDVFAWAAMRFRFYTGKYIFEDEINNAKDPAKFFEQMSEKEIDSIVKRKLDKQYDSIPAGEAKNLRTCLRADPMKRPSIEEAINDYESRTWISKIGRNPKFAKAVAWGMIALAGIGAGTIGYREVVKQKEITKLNMQIEEEKKFVVTAEWADNLRIMNNLVNVNVTVYIPNAKKSLHFPSDEVVRVNPGDECQVTISAKEVAGRKAAKGTLSLSGQVYLVGFDAKSFQVSPAPVSNNWSYYDGMMAYNQHSYNDIEIPTHIRSGNYAIAVELYAPNKDWEGYKFTQKGKAISRILIPVVVGNLKDSELVNLTDVKYGHSMGVNVEVRNVNKNEHWHKNLDKNLSYELFSASGYHELFDGKKNYSSNLFSNRISIPHPTGIDKDLLGMIVRSASGKPLSIAVVPIVGENIYENLNYQPMYFWKADLPDQQFAEKAKKFYRKYFN